MSIFTTALNYDITIDETTESRSSNGTLDYDITSHKPTGTGEFVFW